MNTLHSVTCPGGPNMKGFCAPPCPAYQTHEEAQLALITHELKSQGIVSVETNDGRLFLFSRAVIEELYRQLQTNPQAEQLHFMVFRDRATMQAAKAKMAGAC